MSSERQSPDERRYPIGGRMADVVLGLARRFRLESLMERHSTVPVLGLFAFLNGLLSIALMALVALATRQPFVFPSLGPTAFLLFYTPQAPTASPRNTLCGHLIGVIAGYASLAAFGLLHAGPSILVGVSWARVGAAALSLGLTAGFMVWLRVPHPPAGATTLIVSLGLIAGLAKLAVLMAGVLLLVVQGFVINRLAGIDYPIWSPRTPRGERPEQSPDARARS
ncbi:MAG TPA: HPP family protein [Actinomycetota bacterium]|nr:HPP family protein [Actinomycetota bacterium]